MKTIKNFNIELFPGFYGSIYEAYDEDVVYSIMNALECTEERAREIANLLNWESFEECFEFDSEAYRRDVANTFTRCYISALEGVLGVDIKCSNVHIWSPRFYNFESDEILCNIEVGDDFFAKFNGLVRENYETLKEWVFEQYSSRDGFESYIGGDIDVWISEINSEYWGDQTANMLSVLCGYLLKIDDADICDYLHEQVICEYGISPEGYYLPIESGLKKWGILTVGNFDVPKIFNFPTIDNNTKIKLYY